ncbi:hypothetical protein EW146_g5562, partial [Bondarzewia mesenterica]
LETIHERTSLQLGQCKPGAVLGGVDWTRMSVEKKLIPTKLLITKTADGEEVCCGYEKNACKIMAKDLVQTRRYVQKFYQMRMQLQATMKGMNCGMNLPAIQHIMNEFEWESAIMDMKEEMMSDAVDNVIDGDFEEEEEEGDKFLKEVLDEIGVRLSQ